MNGMPEYRPMTSFAPLEAYRRMLVIRRVEECILDLFSSGWVGELPTPASVRRPMQWASWANWTPSATMF